VQVLYDRLVPRIRAVVIVPTRELADQVHTVFNKFCGTPHASYTGPSTATLRAVSLVGQTSFSEELRQIGGSSSSSGSGPPDIVVCTPGRLVEHCRHEGGGGGIFAAVRWLVLDEADRLLTQAYQQWLQVVMQMVHRRHGPPQGMSDGPGRQMVSLNTGRCPLQKLLLSATMTKNPQKMAHLQLHRPLFFLSSDTGQYGTPASLSQFYCVCQDDKKTLALTHIMLHLTGQVSAAGEDRLRCVVFCASRDTAHRLARLLQILVQMEAGQGQEGDEREEGGDGGLSGLRVAEFSASLNQQRRFKLMKDFK